MGVGGTGVAVGTEVGVGVGVLVGVDVGPGVGVGVGSAQQNPPVAPQLKLKRSVVQSLERGTQLPPFEALQRAVAGVGVGVATGTVVGVGVGGIGVGAEVMDTEHHSVTHVLNVLSIRQVFPKLV